MLRTNAISATCWSMLFALIILACSPAAADVKLPTLFSDHMVLQRDQAIPVWGWASPGEQVRVELAGHRQSTNADTNGKWMVKLPALRVGGPHYLTVAGGSTTRISDVLIGEVWLCSGQSNMAITTDIGEAGDIHPKNKQDVGKRLAQWALATVYERDMVPMGPVYRSMSRRGDKIIISFAHVGDGLVCKNGDSLKGFAICGADKKFVWANAQIDGNSVVVWNDKIKKPLSVRYAWASNPVCNLYNTAGLPASPFRTDDWRETNP